MRRRYSLDNVLSFHLPRVLTHFFLPSLPARAGLPAKFPRELTPDIPKEMGPLAKTRRVSARPRTVPMVANGFEPFLPSTGMPWRLFERRRENAPLDSAVAPTCGSHFAFCPNHAAPATRRPGGIHALGFLSPFLFFSPYTFSGMQKTTNFSTTEKWCAGQEPTRREQYHQA